MLLAGADTLHAEKRLINSLPQKSSVIQNFSRSKLIDSLRKLPLHHIEGIWRFPATGVEVAIVRDNRSQRASADLYRMILLDSENRATRPGTVMGLITPAATPGEYDARIYTSALGSSLILPKNFTLTLSNDDSSLRFKQHKSAITVNLWRLLPYLWRYTIYPTNRSDQHSDGCYRIFPNPPAPREPIYL